MMMSRFLVFMERVLILLRLLKKIKKYLYFLAVSVRRRMYVIVLQKLAWASVMFI